jgi:iron complex transport system substrate-binding protein
MRLQGKLFAKEVRVEAIIGKMEKFLDLVKEKTSKIPLEQKKKVLWLYGKPTLVACGASVPNDLIGMIGGINPAAGILQQNSDVSIEQIIAWNPDVIFIWGNASYSAQSVLESPQWKSIKAVSEGRVHKAPPWSNWSPGVASVILWMATKTYPDFFQDVDFEGLCDDFYREVYGIPYVKVGRIER